MKHPSLDVTQLQAVARLFATLAEPSRLQLLQCLKSGEQSVSELVDQTGLKQANVSKQLGLLVSADLVGRRQDGNRALYSISMPLVFELCDLVCNGMAAKAAAYANALKRRRR